MVTYVGKNMFLGDRHAHLKGAEGQRPPPPKDPLLTSYGLT